MRLEEAKLLGPTLDRAASKHSGRQGIQVLTRAADILRALKDDTSGLSLGKIAQRVALPRSTVQRIVNALVDENLVSSAPASTGYMIGPEILALAQAAQRDVALCLRPLMEELSQQTGETVDLALFKDQQMIFIDQVAGTQRLRAVSAIGESFPMSVTANGKAALAQLSDPTCSRILEHELKDGIGTQSVKQMLDQLNEVRKLGYALDDDEHTEGISAVGIAFTVEQSIYALSIPAPSHRYRREKKDFLRRLLNAKPEIRNAIPGAMIAGFNGD